LVRAFVTRNRHAWIEGAQVRGGEHQKRKTFRDKYEERGPEFHVVIGGIRKKGEY